MNETIYKKLNNKLYACFDGKMIPIASPPTNWDLIDEYVQFLSISVLKASRDYYWDRWTWDTGSDEDQRLAQALDSEIEHRVSTRLSSPYFSSSVPSSVHIRQMTDRRHNQ